MQEHWRWLLVDKLARGMGWFPADTSKTNFYFEQVGFEIEEAKKIKDQVVALSVIEELKRKVDDAVQRYDEETRIHLMTTPRFDITSTAFIKNDIPDSPEEYLSTLPVLAIPFDDFWMEWTLIREDRDTPAKVTTRIQRNPPSSDGSFSLHLDTFAFPSVNPGQEEICLRIESTVNMGSDGKSKKLIFEGSSRDVTLAIPAIHAMALLSCRNVSTSQVNPPRAANRHAMRTEGVALCSYHVVQIQMGKKRHHLGEGKNESHRPLSICRGHFKTYDEKPLLGKITGTWWWSNHVRGDYEYGVIAKDYSLGKLA